jgi:hypothetical protein
VIQRSEQKQARLEFLTALGRKLELLGFSTMTREQCYYRDNGSGKWVLHIAFIPHAQDIDLTADIAIRIGAVEDLVNQYDTKLSPQEKRNSMTLGGELGNLSVGKNIRFTIDYATSISTICDQVLEQFEVVGIPLLHRYSDIGEVHRLLSSSDRTDTVLCPFKGPRYMRAVAAASILGTDISINALIRQFDAELAQDRDLYQADFRTMSKALFPASL